MKSLVIYDTQVDNIEQIAHAISTVFAQHCEGSMLHASRVQPYHFLDVSLLAMGSPTIESPTREFTMTPALRVLLGSIPDGALCGTVALAFDTRVPDSPWLAGSASEQIEGELLRLGCIMLDRHESFALEGPQGPLAEGEVRRALRWADEALENLELPGFSLIEHSITQPRWSQAGTLSEAVAAMR